MSELLITPATGIPTICCCTHHLLEHVTVVGCDLCACQGFAAKVSIRRWRDEEHALVSTPGRYEGNEPLELKEDSHV